MLVFKTKDDYVNVARSVVASHWFQWSSTVSRLDCPLACVTHYFLWQHRQIWGRVLEHPKRHFLIIYNSTTLQICATAQCRLALGAKRLCPCRVWSQPARQLSCRIKIPEWSWLTQQDSFKQVIGFYVYRLCDKIYAQSPSPCAGSWRISAEPGSCPATTSYNVTSGLLTIARFFMAFHYEYILSMWGGCPVVVAIGHPETGKSTAIVMGLAMTGLVKNISRSPRQDEIVHEKWKNEGRAWTERTHM